MHLQKLIINLTFSSLALNLVTGCDGNMLTPNQSDDVESIATESKESNAEAMRTDALDGDAVVMPKATYKDVTFEEGKITFTDESKEELKALADELDKSKDVYLTVRAVDSDTIEATEPKEPFASLVNERFQAINRHLGLLGLAISESRLDDSGKVSSYGEDNALARPSSDVNEEDYQIVILRFRGA